MKEIRTDLDDSFDIQNACHQTVYYIISCTIVQEVATENCCLVSGF